MIIPLLINYYYFSKKLKNNIDNKIIKLDFFISLFLIVICYVYELHTNNSAVSSLLFYYPLTKTYLFSVRWKGAIVLRPSVLFLTGKGTIVPFGGKEVVAMEETLVRPML